MKKTLVIILGETRGHELTFDNFKKNIIDELNADLCICIGVKENYDYTNPFYQLSKYKFLYNEPDDFSSAFEYAYNTISLGRCKYEKIQNINALHSKLKYPTQCTNDITYYGKYNSNTDINKYNDNILVIHSNKFIDKSWAGQIYGINGENIDKTFVDQQDVDTYKKPFHWREFLKIKNQFLGGIKDKYNEHPGSAGILIFFRWFLLKNIIDNNLINEYDRFVITRSDFIYRLPHPKVTNMNDECIWIPDCEHYGGYTDRHAVLSDKNIEKYLNILNNMVLRSNRYFDKMKNYCWWNLERLIKFHLEENNILQQVQEIPYMMYSVRNINGTTRWASGSYSHELGYFIKYDSEYNKSLKYENEFKNSNLDINEFYKSKIKNYCIL